MENNRRSFFKGIAAFVGGIAVAKLDSYTPKEEKKDDLMVSSAVTIMHDGQEYHPLIVKKTEYDRMDEAPVDPKSPFLFRGLKPTIRKANV